LRDIKPAQQKSQGFHQLFSLETYEHCIYVCVYLDFKKHMIYDFLFLLFQRKKHHINELG